MNFSNVDRLLKISYIVPADDCEQAIQTNIQTSLLLKNCLESIKPLIVVLDSTISECFSEMKNVISFSTLNKCFNDYSINSSFYVFPSIKRLSIKLMKLCNLTSI